MKEEAEDVCGSRDESVSSVVQRRVALIGSSRTITSRWPQAYVLHLANNDLKWRGERPRLGGAERGQLLTHIGSEM